MVTVWKRLPIISPEIVLFNDVDENDQLGWFDEVTQGGIGNCYLIATLSGSARFPEIIKDLFTAQESDQAGIYQTQMYVRGKPWTLTIDDTVLFNKDRNNLEHVEYKVDKPSMWGPLLEKAWSKIDATFLNSEAGFTFQAMRAVLGCPVAYYFTGTTRLSGRDLWRTIRSQMLTNKYLFIASTASDGMGDTEYSLNECGITMAHAFPVLAAFPLYNPSR